MKTRMVLLALALSAWPMQAEDYPDKVVIVLDASGSMKGMLQGNMDKMTAAKSALKTVLQKVPATTHIGLLVFSARNLKDDWAYPLGPRRDQELIQAIDSIEPHGDTPLGRYIKRGADRLLEERAKQFGYGSYRLLVVTDGEAQDQNLVERYTPEVIARGITADVIGVGMKQDHTLATKVHSYRRANDLSALSRAVSEVFAEVSSTGKDVTRAEGFDLIASIPEKVAAAMIQALSTSGNQPIGEKPKPPADGGQTTQPNATALAAPTAFPAAPSSRGQRNNAFPVGMAVVVIIFATLVARKAIRRSR